MSIQYSWEIDEKKTFITFKFENIWYLDLYITILLVSRISFLVCSKFFSICKTFKKTDSYVRFCSALQTCWVNVLLWTKVTFVSLNFISSQHVEIPKHVIFKTIVQSFKQMLYFIFYCETQGANSAYYFCMLLS